MSESQSDMGNILEQDYPFYCFALDQSHSVINSIANHSRVCGYLIKKLWNRFPFFYKPNVLEGILTQLDCLIEPVFTPVADIHNVYDLFSQSRVKHLCLLQLVLEISWTCQNYADNVHLITSEKTSLCNLTDLPQVVVSFFNPQSAKTHRGLSSLPVFFRQLDCKFVDDFLSPALQSSIKCAITINNNETKRRLICKQLLF